VDAERLLADRLLARIEVAERAALRKIGLTDTSREAVELLLQVTTARVDKHPTARLSLQALAWAAEAREHIRDAANPAAAAYAALLAGLFASEGAVKAALSTDRVERQKRAGKARGAQIAEDAREQDRRIKRLLRHYQVSDDLQDKYSTAAKYIEACTKAPIYTIRRRLKKIREQ